MPQRPVESLLLRAWQSRGPLACLLWPLSRLYGLLADLRRTLYRLRWLRTGAVGVPVVVIGNVVAGGSGKTPVVMALAKHFKRRGLPVGVVSRGHGRVIAPGDPDCREVFPGSAPAEAGDEPLLIRRSTGVPVFVAGRRLEAARALLAHYPETRLILCDDGLQHFALHRDLEICVFDDRGIGNGWLLPAGPLRESWPRDVDLVLHTGARPAFDGFRARRFLAGHALRQDGSLVPLANLRGQPVVAVAAIAQPEAFFAMLRAAGLTLAQAIALPDHDDFSGWTPPKGSATLVCTEKDAAKLWPQSPDALAVPLEVSLDPAFLAALDGHTALAAATAATAIDR